MTEGLPLSYSYNLGRLGNAGDAVQFAADDAQRAAIARWSGVLSVDRLEVRVHCMASFGDLVFEWTFLYYYCEKGMCI